MQSGPIPNRLPAIAFITAALSTTGMIVWSILQWPAMEPSIVTREAAGNHGTSTVPRLLTACAMPATLTVLTVLLGLAPRVDGRLWKLLGDPGAASKQNQQGSPRVLGIFLIGLSVLLATLHVAFVSPHTPGELPTAPLISTAIGVLLALLGIALPSITPVTITETEFETRLRDAQRHLYRRVAPFVMLAIGIATIVAAWLAPALAMPIAVGGIAVLFIGIGVIAVSRARAS